jgi:glycine cleavage system H protein
MPDDLTFLMGKFPAVLPGSLRYASNHMWARPIPVDDSLRESSSARGASGLHWRFGFTTYAIRLMQDVYFLDWSVSAGDAVHLLQHIGHIETSKAVSDLFAPLDGTLVSFNAGLLDDPSGINVDGYGAGWLFEMAGPGETLLTVSEYHQHLADNWEKTQRLIKGKINAEE